MGAVTDSRRAYSHRAAAAAPCKRTRMASVSTHGPRHALLLGGRVQRVRMYPKVDALALFLSNKLAG